MSREVVYIRGNGRSSRVTRSDVTYTGFATETGPVLPRLNDEIDTTSATASGLSVSSGTLYNNVYIAVTWVASPDPNVVAYNVVFNRDSGQAITVQQVDGTSAYFEPAVGGSSYEITVSNVYPNGSLGTQTVSDTVTAAVDNTVPATPTGLSIGTGIRSITISWDENTEPDTQFGLGQYRVQLSNDGTFSGADIIRDKVVGALVTTFADLATDVQYWARVAAVDTSGNESTFSASVNATTGEVQGTDIADLAITNAKIANATIAAAKIIELNANQLVAGTGFINALTINSGGSIESSNYDNVGPVYAGWKIDENSAVFNNVTVRGTLEGTTGDFTGDINSGSTITGATISGGSINISSGTFEVTTGGALTATSATIEGNISASSISGSTITGSTITGTTLTSGTGQHIEVTSNDIEFYSGTTTLQGVIDGYSGGLRISASAGFAGSLVLNADDVAASILNGSTWNIGASSSHSILFNSTEKFRFRNDGVGVDGGSNRGLSCATGGLFYYWRQINSSSANIFGLASSLGGSQTTVFTVAGNGDTKNSTGVYGTLTSDQRAKSNIIDLQDAIDIGGTLRSFKPRQFDLTHQITEEHELEVRDEPLVGHYGWIAQESPRWFVTELGEYWTTKDSIMIPVLHAGWRYNDERIMELEAQVAALQDTISNLS